MSNNNYDGHYDDLDALVKVVQRAQQYQSNVREENPEYTDDGKPFTQTNPGSYHEKNRKVIDYRKSVGNKKKTAHNKARKIYDIDKALISAIVAGCLAITFFVATSPKKDDYASAYVQQIQENSDATINECIRILQNQALTELRHYGLADINIESVFLEGNKFTITINDNSVEDYKKLGEFSAIRLKVFKNILPKDEYKKLLEANPTVEQLSDEEFEAQIYQKADSIREQYKPKQNGYAISYLNNQTRDISELSDEAIINLCTNQLQKQMLDKLLNSGLAEIVIEKNLLNQPTITIKITGNEISYLSNNIIENELDAYILNLIDPRSGILSYEYLAKYENDDNKAPGDLFDEAMKEKILKNYSSILNGNETNDKDSGYFYELGYNYIDGTPYDDEAPGVSGRSR